MDKLTMTALLSSKNPPFFLKMLQDLPDLHRLIIAFLIKPSMKRGDAAGAGLRMFDESPITDANHYSLWLDLIRPKKLPCSHCINRNRNHEKRDFADPDFRWAIACQYQKHPGKQNHGVAIGKLPASGVSVTPKNERQDRYRHPCDALVSSALAKK
jgi:hypothetical protein